VRNSENTLTIYGSNGNLAPAAGEKAFNRDECLQFYEGGSNNVAPSARIPRASTDDGISVVDAGTRLAVGVAGVAMFPIIRRRRKSKGAPR
jgi:hypothetical protein